jgi:hypothetical protein
VTDYGSIAPLCDIRGCIEPQSGECVEIPLAPDLWVRVQPCGVHGQRLVEGVNLADEVRRLREAVDAFWAEAGAFTVQVLTEERPEVVALAMDNHELLHHS